MVLAQELDGVNDCYKKIMLDTKLIMNCYICYILFPQAAKLANYAKYQRLCDSLFIVFSVVFFITRLVIYPIW